MPVRFLRKRIVPSSPTSFVNPAWRAAAVNTGARNSAPTSDHVPELMYAHGSSPDAGTAATADAVSCEHDATTRGPRPRPRAAAGSASRRTGPRTVPGFTIVGQRAGSSPAARITSCDHAPARTSHSCVVLAIVRSATGRPLRR